MVGYRIHESIMGLLVSFLSRLDQEVNAHDEHDGRHIASSDASLSKILL